MTTTVLSGIQTTLETAWAGTNFAGTPILWVGELAQPEPTAFIVLQGGFTTPYDTWAEKRHAIKTVQVTACHVTFGGCDTLAQAIRDALPADTYWVQQLSGPTLVGDRFEQNLSIQTT